MSRMTPTTSNPEAAYLINAAIAQCAGCRMSWRIRRNWTHDRTKIECTAKVERQSLRDIAAQCRAQEKSK